MPNDRETIALPGLPGWRFERTAVTSSFYNLVNRDGASAVTWEEARAFAAALTAQPAPVAGQPARKTCELVEGGVGLGEIERYFTLPLSFHEPHGNETTAWIRDAKNNTVAMLMWPGHPVEETERAEQATYALGRLMTAALARPVSPQDAGVVRDRALEEAALAVDVMRHPDFSSETADWIEGTFAAAALIRALRTTPPSDQPEKAEASASDQGRVLFVLKRIAEGYRATSKDDRFVIVENPDYKPDDGSDPNIVLDITTLKQSTQPAQAGAGVVGRDDDETTYLIKAVGEQVEQEQSGLWSACSGCQESNEGYLSPKLWPHSAIFRTQPGAGCRECGGIGVIWEGAGPPKALVYRPASDAAIEARTHAALKAFYDPLRSTAGAWPEAHITRMRAALEAADAMDDDRSATKEDIGKTLNIIARSSASWQEAAERFVAVIAVHQTLAPDTVSAILWGEDYASDDLRMFKYLTEAERGDYLRRAQQIIKRLERAGIARSPLSTAETNGVDQP